MKFSDLTLHEQVLKGIENAGFETCMKVQEEALPVCLTGKDIMVQSKTGSGKTAVFVITFLETYLRKKEEGEDTSCLVIAPTRELAQQIAAVAKTLSSGIKGFTTGCFYGGVGYDAQEKLLKKGCNLYVGTPGRLIEFMKEGRIDSKKITTFVIDEADRLFDMGF
ncbi:MAG: DEAD/DEAH box helicase, partial [Sphaerochaetaceae bacterium]|nr:DEAD/DEAH box helicase [Sphaerochaetaceae bacterium]